MLAVEISDTHMWVAAETWERHPTRDVLLNPPNFGIQSYSARNPGIWAYSVQEPSLTESRKIWQQKHWFFDVFGHLQDLKKVEISESQNLKIYNSNSDDFMILIFLYSHKIWKILIFHCFLVIFFVSRVFYFSCQTCGKTRQIPGFLTL